jgi:hypothetical protein
MRYIVGELDRSCFIILPLPFMSNLAHCCWTYRPGVVPAVLELGDLTIENLSSTRVMRYITDRCILNDRVFFILALDFFLSLFILMGFRLNVELLLRDAGADYADEKTYIYYGTSGTCENEVIPPPADV